MKSINTLIKYANYIVKNNILLTEFAKKVHANPLKNPLIPSIS